MNGNANERQVGGEHYRKGNSALQHWDLVALFEWDYFQAQITRYVMRWKEKNGIEDLEKARHYIDKYIEIVKLRQRGDLTMEILREALKELGRVADEKREIAEAIEIGAGLSIKADETPSGKRGVPRSVGELFRRLDEEDDNQ